MRALGPDHAEVLVLDRAQGHGADQGEPLRDDLAVRVGDRHGELLAGLQVRLDGVVPGELKGPGDEVAALRDELDVLSRLTDRYFERLERAGQASTPKAREYRERLEARANEDLENYGPIPPAWKEHRGVLAEILPDQAWQTIEEAMTTLELNKGLPPPDPNWVGNVEDFEEWEAMQDRFHEARRVLNAYSGRSPRISLARSRVHEKVDRRRVRRQQKKRDKERRRRLSAADGAGSPADGD